MSTESEYAITIDDYKFIIIGKSINDNNPEFLNYYKSGSIIEFEDRNKLRIKSVNLTTGEILIYNLYTSVSEMFCWRLCFIKPESENVFNKFDNYIQATLIDLRLQKYIWDNFDSFAFIGNKEANISSEKISKFTYDNENLLIDILNTENETDTLNDLLDDDLLDIENLTKKNKKEKLNEIICKKQKEMYVKQNEIYKKQKEICEFNKKINENNILNEKYKEQLNQINPFGIINCSFNDKNITNYVDKRGIQINNLNIKNFYNYFDINNLNDKIKYVKYNKTYGNKDFYVEIYGIRITNKTTSENIIAQIMNVKVIIDKDIIREGKTIINFINETTKINKYGLYSNYYVEDKQKSQMQIISKPIEYKIQSNYEIFYYNISTLIETGYYNDLKIFNIGKFITKKIINKSNWDKIKIIHIIVLNNLITNGEVNIDSPDFSLDKIFDKLNDIVSVDYSQIIKNNLKTIVKQNKINDHIIDFYKNSNIITFLENYSINVMSNIYDEKYEFIAHINKIKPIIKELFNEETITNDFLMKKYIKYKNKYNKLKNLLH